MKENYQIQQRRLFHKITSTIYHEGVHVEYKTLFTEKEYALQFKSILNEPEKEITYSKWWLFGCVLCFLWTMLIAFHTSDEKFLGNFILVLSFLSFTAFKFYISIKNIYVLAKYPNWLFFYKKIPSEDAVNDFIKLIYTKKEEYESIEINKNYNMSKLDGLERLSVLLQNGHITKEEYEKVKAEMINKDDDSGFGFVSLN